MQISVKNARLFGGAAIKAERASQVGTSRCVWARGGQCEITVNNRWTQWDGYTARRRARTCRKWGRRSLLSPLCCMQDACNTMGRRAHSGEAMHTKAHWGHQFVLIGQQCHDRNVANKMRIKFRRLAILVRRGGGPRRGEGLQRNCPQTEMAEPPSPCPSLQCTKHWKVKECQTRGLAPRVSVFWPPPLSPQDPCVQEAPARKAAHVQNIHKWSMHFPQKNHIRLVSSGQDSKEAQRLRSWWRM